MDGAYVLGVILTIVGGIALAVQSGANSTLGITSGCKPFSSVVSFSLGLVVCLLYFAIDTQGLHHKLPSAAGIKAAPWWAWIGGFLGAYYVIIVIIFAQKLGAGTLVAIFVCAQLITSIVLDLTGLVGFSRRDFSWQRWVGAALMIAGVVLVTQFPGDLVTSQQQLAAKQQVQDSSADSSSSHSRHLSTMELGHLGYMAPASAAGDHATARVLADSAVDLEAAGQSQRGGFLAKIQRIS